MRRVAWILTLAAALWFGISIASTNLRPADDQECYLSAVWTSPGWDYGKLVCFDEPDPTAPPAVRDPRPEPELIRVYSAEQGLALMDAQTVAELAVAEDPRAPSAVAHVVRNRARARGQSVLAVVIARRQFGTMRAGRWHASWPRSQRWVRAHRSAIEAALPRVTRALAGRGSDPTRGATCFHRVGSWTPPWAPSPRQWRRLGSHWFYRPLEAHRRPQTASAGAPQGAGQPGTL